MTAKLNQRLLKAIINALIIVAILSVAYSISTQIRTEEFQFPFDIKDLLTIILLSAALLLISSLAWRGLLSARHEKVEYLFALEQTSMMLISKYIPGKVWAIFLRAAMSKKLGFSSSEIISLSILEQLLSMYISTVGGMILILYYYHPLAAIPCAVLFFITGYWLFKLAYCLAQRLLSSINQRGYLKNLILENLELMPRQYFLFTFLYIVLWVLIGLILNTLVSIIAPTIGLNQFILILGGYMVSVTIGYLAFFAPGGIGVREGIFIAITSTLISPALALKLSIMIRLWNTVYDLIAGLIGYLNYLRRESTSKT